MDNQTTRDIVVFVIAFLVGFVWYRIGLVIFPTYFKKPFLRTVLKTSWHHLHHGIVLLASGLVCLLIYGKTRPVLILLGAGFGLVVDEFFAFMKYETNRDQELVAYQQSFFPTFIVTLGIVLVIFTLYLAKFVW